MSCRRRPASRVFRARDVRGKGAGGQTAALKFWRSTRWRGPTALRCSASRPAAQLASRPAGAALRQVPRVSSRGARCARAGREACAPRRQNSLRGLPAHPFAQHRRRVFRRPWLLESRGFGRADVTTTDGHHCPQRADGPQFPSCAARFHFARPCGERTAATKQLPRIRLCRSAGGAPWGGAPKALRGDSFQSTSSRIQYQRYRKRWPKRRNGAKARERTALSTLGYSSGVL